MTTEQLSYGGASLTVRDDLVAAHQKTWEHIARPGTWWTGAERVAIAAETRNAGGCSLCAKRKEALSPYAVAGSHDSLGALTDPVVDVIHRVVTDPGRLTERLVRESAETDLSDAHYVEAVSIVVFVVNVDTFARAIGAPLHPLPNALPGEPSRVRPPADRADGAWVPLIAADVAERDYPGLYSGGALTPYIQRALSLVPDETRHFTETIGAEYVPPGDLFTPLSNRAISRPQIELLAARVSAVNECFY